MRTSKTSHTRFGIDHDTTLALVLQHRRQSDNTITAKRFRQSRATDRVQLFPHMGDELDLPTRTAQRTVWEHRRPPPPGSGQIDFDVEEGQPLFPDG